LRTLIVLLPSLVNLLFLTLPINHLRQKSAWAQDPDERPTAKEMLETLRSWKQPKTPGDKEEKTTTTTPEATKVHDQL